MTHDTEISEFIVGQCYSNDQIFRSLKVGNAGGVRICLQDRSSVRRMVVMTSVSQPRQRVENPYHDRIEGDVLVYTGAGREGDQRLSGPNSRLPQQVDSIFPIYGFEILGSRRDRKLAPKRWRFLGLLEYIRHYQEQQVDTRGVERLAWMFEFLIHRDPLAIPIKMDAQIAKSMREKSASNATETQEDRQVEETSSQDEPLTSQMSIVESQAIRTRLLSISPIQFEHVVKEVFIHSGFDRVQVTKYSQDGGIDVNAYPGVLMWPLGEMLVQAQAKRWLHTVGRRDVAELRGSLEPFARGVLVTTSRFTKAAIIEANAPGKNPIVLIDGNRFGSIISSLGPSMIDRLNFDES